jgi:DNA-binding transcriptional LysR family regulator
MMDLGRLRALHAVAVHGSVGRAAAALGYTPSAISQQISKLERETRTPLLEKRGRGVVLTDAAQELAHTAQAVLALVEQAEVDLESRRGEVTGRLSLAAFATAARGLLPTALADLSAAHPELVARGEVDLAVVQDWPNTPLATPEGVCRRRLGEDPVDVVLPADHPLAAREVLTVEELKGQRWVNTPPGTICHDWLLQTLREAGEDPDTRFQATEFDTQIALIRAGLCIGLVPRLGRAPLPAGVVARPIVPEPTRRVSVLWREHATRRPAIAAALDALQRHWPQRSAAPEPAPSPAPAPAHAPAQEPEDRGARGSR